VKALPVSACVMTNATPAGGAIVTGGDVAVGLAGPGRAVDGFGLGVALGAGVCGGMETAAVGVTAAVAVATAVAVGVDDAGGTAALRWWVQPARATTPATTAQHPVRCLAMSPMPPVPPVFPYAR
jgi:hypothetical protein